MCCSDIQFTISAKNVLKNSTPNWFYSLFCDPQSPVFALILTFSHANAPILHATGTHIMYRELGLWRQLTIVEKLKHPDSVVCPSATFASSFAQYMSSLAQHFRCGPGRLVSCQRGCHRLFREGERVPASAVMEAPEKRRYRSRQHLQTAVIISTGHTSYPAAPNCLVRHPDFPLLQLSA